jgi:uncharacterized protein YjdB
MKIKNSLILILAFAMIFVLAFANMTAFATTSGNKTVNSSGSMGIVLNTGVTGDSSVVSFTVSGLPANSTITKFEVHTGTLTYTGAMLTNYLNLVSSNRTGVEHISWGGAGNTTLQSSLLSGTPAAGTYQISFNCTCLGGAIVGGILTNTGTKSYKNPYIVVYYSYPTLITSISLIPNSTTLNVGRTMSMYASISPINADNKTLNWTSNNTSAARVDSTGLVTAVSAGTAIIRATTTDGSNLSATCTVTVVVPVDNITVNPTALTMHVNDTQTITPTITPSNATDKSVTWSSNNTSVATVNNGTVTAVSPGSAIITARTSNGYTATCTVVVEGILATDVSLGNAPADPMLVNDTITLTATVSPSNATNKNVTWTSDSPDVATVHPNSGLVTAVSAGTATIRATTADGSNISATCTVTVVVPVDNITVDPNTLTMYVGDTQTITPTIIPSNASDKSVTWSSDNTSVATVNNGIVTAVSSGSAIITARTNNEHTATCTVVVEDVLTTDVSIDNAPADPMLVNDTITLTATVSPSNATNKNVAWTSDSPDVATVDPNSGLVTAVGVGTATITATADDGNSYSSCEIEVTQ